MGFHPHIVSHDAELVEGGLPVEEDHIVVDEVPFDNIPILQPEKGKCGKGSPPQQTTQINP